MEIPQNDILESLIPGYSRENFHAFLESKGYANTDDDDCSPFWCSMCEVTPRVAFLKYLIRRLERSTTK
jgi:hypothetical protein